MAAQDPNGAAWGGPADMSAWEALMWRAEADPRTRSTGVLLEVLDRDPDWDRLVAAHDRVSQQIPRLRERAVEPLLPLFPPAWARHDAPTARPGPGDPGATAGQGATAVGGPAGRGPPGRPGRLPAQGPPQPV